MRQAMCAVTRRRVPLGVRLGPSAAPKPPAQRDRVPAAAVAWAEGQPGRKGLAQDRADAGHSSSYSLPHLRIAGSITYTDERGKPTAVDVSGAGWADRQWGDFPADQGW